MLTNPPGLVRVQRQHCEVIRTGKMSSPLQTHTTGGDSCPDLQVTVFLSLRIRIQSPSPPVRHGSLI